MFEFPNAFINTLDIHAVKILTNHITIVYWCLIIYLLNNRSKLKLLLNLRFLQLNYPYNWALGRADMVVGYPWYSFKGLSATIKYMGATCCHKSYFLLFHMYLVQFLSSEPFKKFLEVFTWCASLFMKKINLFFAYKFIASYKTSAWLLPSKNLWTR